MNPVTSNTESSFRDRIARAIALSVITASGLLGLLGILLGIYYVVNDTDGKGFDRAMNVLQFIFSALLPLWGTWIGTVLAYYFSKENFESANKQVRELVGQVTTANEKLRSLRVSDVMMPFAKLITFPSGPNPDLLVIKDLYDFVEKNQIRRALIFSGKKILYVLHKSLLSDFLYRNQGSPKLATLTIKDMREDLDKDVQNAFINGVGTVPTEANLMDVKAIMDMIPGCQDVFVTVNGQKDGDVLGWISNVDILNKTRA